LAGLRDLNLLTGRYVATKGRSGEFPGLVGPLREGDDLLVGWNGAAKRGKEKRNRPF